MSQDLTPEQSEYIRNFIETLMAGKNCPHCQEPILYKRQVGCCVYASPCGCRLYHGSVDLEPGETPTVSFDLKRIGEQ